jgi:hypothetical protein
VAGSFCAERPVASISLLSRHCRQPRGSPKLNRSRNLTRCLAFTRAPGSLNTMPSLCDDVVTTQTVFRCLDNKIVGEWAVTELRCEDHPWLSCQDPSGPRRRTGACLPQRDLCHCGLAGVPVAAEPGSQRTCEWSCRASRSIPLPPRKEVRDGIFARPRRRRAGLLIETRS